MLIPTLFFVMVVKPTCASLTKAPPTLESGLQCLDIGLGRSMRVIAGESGRIPCPLFSFPTLYSYNQSSGQTLLWYRLTDTHELEEPIHLRAHQFLKYRDSLWIQPTTVQDSGLYICTLRNNSSCVKMGVQLQVFERVGMCDSAVHQNITVPLESQYTLRCPDQQHLPTNSTHNVTWYYNCMKEFTGVHRELKGDELVIYIMYDHYAGPYTCVVSYQSGGHTLQFTRTINIRAVPPRRGTRHPRILNPDSGEIYKVTLGEDAELPCRVFLPYLEDEEGLVWWTIDNKTVKELGDPRYSSPETKVEDDNDDKTVLTMLHVKEFSAADLLREFRCFAQNSRGLNFSIATLEKEVYIPTVELACGLGVTLALAVLLIVLYRVFKLEVHLLYRTWFGTDERNIDDKEYDVYISYARNGEEEEFVMTTLRRVLEVDLGYTVCIFDRDSLPGGNLLECVFRCMQASRRLLVVLSSECVCEKSVSLLECRLCVYLHHTLHTPLITIRRCTLGATCGELTELRRSSTCIRWHGTRSEKPDSRFWKLLRLALPVRPLALGRRLIDSTSSHSDLASVALRHTHTLTHTRQGAVVRGAPKVTGQRGQRQRGRGCDQKGQGCVVCVNFLESRRIWGGATVPQWNTRLQHNATTNGTLTHAPLQTVLNHTTHNVTSDPKDNQDDENRATQWSCDHNHSNHIGEIQTTHC